MIDSLQASQTKPILLYAGIKKTGGFMKGIAYRISTYGSLLVFSIRHNQFEILEGVRGVVFVGPQTSRDRHAVFDNRYDDYFAFVQRAEDMHLKIAAILNEPLILPGANAGIDLLIKRSERRTLKSLAEELECFFSF